MALLAQRRLALPARPALLLGRSARAAAPRPALARAARPLRRCRAARQPPLAQQPGSEQPGDGNKCLPPGPAMRALPEHASSSSSASSSEQPAAAEDEQQKEGRRRKELHPLLAVALSLCSRLAGGRAGGQGSAFEGSCSTEHAKVPR